jgi:ketosteroid isomerase-like protein
MSESETPIPPAARRLTAVFDELLRSPVTTLRRVKADGRLAQTWRLAGGAVLAFVLYGLVAGSFQGLSQMGMAAWKAPVIIAVSALLCAPSLFVFGSLLGASLTPRTLFTVLVGFCAFLGVLLLGLVPIVWLFSASSRSLVFVTWLHVWLWIAAVALAGRYLRAVLGEAGGRGIIVPWLLLFTVVSFQVVTLLRPVLWRAPDGPVLESRTEKLSFFEHLGRTYDVGRTSRTGASTTAASGSGPSSRDRSSTLARVREAERARAAAASSAGVAGLLRHVADDAVVFTPAPANARTVWQTNPASSPAAPGTTREVRTGDVSGSRDVAWVMGTVTTRTDGGTREGCFLSVWRDGPTGWRLVLDAEIPMTVACAFERPGFSPVDEMVVTAWRGDALDALKQSDLRVARVSMERDVAAGLGSALREDARLYRPGISPVTGRAGGRAYLATTPGRTQFTQFGAAVSPDGGLGYTYGRAERTTAEGSVDTQYYIRVWRAWPGGDFAVVVDAQTAGR